MRAGYSRLILTVIAGSFCAHAALAETSSAELIERGRQIYELGRLGSGEPLKADRGQGVVSAGPAAACIKCHQRSGFGLFEATNLVPPVTGPSLFSNAQPLSDAPRHAKGMKHEPFPFLTRPPYDEATLAKAIREGVSPSGYHFHYLMPRYGLGEADMSALISYLRQLSATPSPGIDAKTAHFATVIAPGQDAGRRKAVIDVLNACFQERHPEDASRQAWRLHVWDLEGVPESWQAQLKAKYAEQPVFALVSGLGTDEWGPVDRFAESERIPQLFPNIDVTASANEGDYSFYFWKGVVLEAEVMARYLSEHAAKTGVTRVVQLRLDHGVSTKAAEALRSLIKAPITVEDRVLKQATPDEIKSAMSGLSATDALIVWLGRDALSPLTNIAPPAAGQIIVSGWMSGLESAPLSPDWKRVSLMIYPVDPPQRREARMEFNLRPWLKEYGIKEPDEILLGNTLAACNLLAEGMLRLRGFYFRDHLVEFTENYPIGMGNAPAPEAFPRFLIGPGQRYSSKGAYIVRFKAADLSELELVQDWTVPE